MQYNMAFKQLLIRRNNFILSLIVLVTLLLEHGVCSSFNRSSFPHGFVFGTASSAYQYEGAAREGGRRPSIWDTFTHLHPDKIADGSNGDVAVDFYHRYKEDINNMKKMGMDAFRFSISWPRILPNGSISGGINKEGVNFYNNLINEILSNGMQPFVTIFHWDVPQALEDKYLGFLSLHIIKDYVDYIDICFKEFGDRVKQWITFNEPHSFCTMGYSKGTFAPGRCSSWQEGNCSTGNSATEPYICSHNMLLAHSAAVKLYKDKYQGTQRGKIGITINTPWFLPHTSSKADTIAAKRMLDFFYGWYMDPLTHGDYPVSMRKSVGIRLPKFTKEQSESLRGSYDFLGINYYATYYAISNSASNSLHESYDTDSQAIITVERNGTKFPQPYNTSWIYIYPPGLQDLMLYTKANYKNPVIYITENGVDQLNDNNSLSLKEALNDTIRLSYHRSHLLALRSAIRHGADVRGYFAWSFTDNFEWASGYRNQFGLYFVDYNNNLVRHPKKSAVWFSMFLKK